MTDQFRQSDVTRWGVVATFAVGLAVGAAGLSSFLPQDLFAGLHDSRAVGASRAAFQSALADLQNAKAQIAELTRSQQTLQETSAGLDTRFDGFVQQAGGVRMRLEKLEKTLPEIVDALSPVAPTDPTVITGSIGKSTARTTSFDAPGGSVTVSQSPLVLPADPHAPGGGMDAAQFRAIPAEAMPAVPSPARLPGD